MPERIEFGNWQTPVATSLWSCSHPRQAWVGAFAISAPSSPAKVSMTPVEGRRGDRPSRHIHYLRALEGFSGPKRSCLETFQPFELPPEDPSAIFPLRPIALLQDVQGVR